MTRGQTTHHALPARASKQTKPSPPPPLVHALQAGGMFAGHDESGGKLVERDGAFYKLFYGMSSATAMKKHAGGVAEYRSSEGKTVEVPYRGPVDATICDILGGIRSTCTYIGARSLKYMPSCATFVRVTQQLNPVFNSAKQLDVPPGLRKQLRARVAADSAADEPAAKRRKP